MIKNKQEKIAASELRYRRLFETAQDGIIILDGVTKKIYDANPFLLDMIGYQLKELVGKELWNIGLFKNIAEAKKLDRELTVKGYARYEHAPLQNKNKKIVEAEFVCNSYQVDGKKVIQCNVRDIGERIIAAKLLAAHADSIERLNKFLVGREIRMTELKKEIVHLKGLNDKLESRLE